MKNIGIIAFRFGESRSEPLSQKFIDLYIWVSQVITGDDCQTIHPEDHATIPLDNHTISHSPYSIYHLFFNSKGEWEGKADIIVIDLANPEHGLVRGTALIHLAQAVDAVCKELGNPPLFILLLPSLPPPEDRFYVILEHLLSEKKVVLIGDGELNREFDISSQQFAPANYRSKLMQARASPLELLKLRIIRRLGHFFRRDHTGKHYQCVKYYYDGSLCSEELIRLFQQYLEEHYASGNNPKVIYHAPISPWLSKAVLIWAQESGLKCSDADTVQNWETELGQEVVRPLIIVPCVYSGNTVTDVIGKVVKNGPLSPRILSVLSTFSTDKEAHIRKLKTQYGTYDINYFLEIKNISYDPSTTSHNPCPMCKLRIPESDPNKDDYAMLTTFDMWHMVEEVGFKLEEDVPEYRKSLGNVPKFPELVERNGAWFATKVRLILNMTPQGFPSTPLIVCPDEIGSIVFTDFLKAILNIDAIRIPRDVINSYIRPDDEAIKKIEQQKGLWYQQLASASIPRVIVMDEFNFSGVTRQGLSNLLDHFGKSVLWYFSIVDFNPSGSASSGMPSYCFYSFDHVSEERGQADK